MALAILLNHNIPPSSSFVPFCSAPSLVVRFQELLRFVSPMAEGEKDTLKGLEQVNILGIVGVGMM